MEPWASLFIQLGEGPQAMRYGLFLLAGVATLATGIATAEASDTSIGATFTTERGPEDFSSTTGSDWQIDLSHTFDNKVSISGTVKYYDTAGTSNSKTNAQFGLGYTYEFGKLSLTGTVGIGQHFIHSDDSTQFPYYYVSVAGTVPIAEKWTWTMFRLRYRNAFDTSNDYDTPEVATGVGYKFDAHNSVSLFIERDWSNGTASYTGIEVGYRYHF